MHRIVATRPSVVPLVLRVLAGALFVGAGIGKFAQRSAEIDSFTKWDVPWPQFTVALVGVLELVGGALLLVGLMTRPVALLLAANMLGAILTAGRVEGGPFHLGVAPALLVAMVILVRTGGGRGSIDLRLSGDARRVRPG